MDQDGGDRDQVKRCCSQWIKWSLPTDITGGEVYWPAGSGGMRWPLSLKLRGPSEHWADTHTHFRNTTLLCVAQSVLRYSLLNLKCVSMWKSNLSSLWSGELPCYLKQVKRASMLPSLWGRVCCCSCSLAELGWGWSGLVPPPPELQTQRGHSDVICAQSKTKTLGLIWRQTCSSTFISARWLRPNLVLLFFTFHQQISTSSSYTLHQHLLHQQLSDTAQETWEQMVSVIKCLFLFWRDGWNIKTVIPSPSHHSHQSLVTDDSTSTSKHYFVRAVRVQ